MQDFFRLQNTEKNSFTKLYGKKSLAPTRFKKNIIIIFQPFLGTNCSGLREIPTQSQTVSLGFYSQYDRNERT